jgi:hypothetical protein
VPEPVASRAHLYDDDALAALVRRAGLTEVAVANDGGGRLVTALA